MILLLQDCNKKQSKLEISQGRYSVYIRQTSIQQLRVQTGYKKSTKPSFYTSEQSKQCNFPRTIDNPAQKKSVTALCRMTRRRLGAHQVLQEHASTVDSFLWHTFSVPYDRCSGSMIHNDRTFPVSGYEAVSPPRGTVSCVHSHAPETLARRVQAWIHRKGLRIVRQRHGVACPESRKIMFVDLVLETSRMEPVIVCLFADVKRRKGQAWLDILEYLRKVKSVCNKKMRFYPEVRPAYTPRNLFQSKLTKFFRSSPYASAEELRTTISSSTESLHSIIFIQGCWEPSIVRQAGSSSIQ